MVQVPDGEIEEMVLLAKRVGGYIHPMVCMDTDGLALGISAQFDDGVIDASEKDRLLAFVASHVDAPRAPRVSRPRSWRPERVILLAMTLSLCFVMAAGRGFWIWFLRFVAALTISEYGPYRWLRWPRWGRRR